MSALSRLGLLVSILVGAVGCRRAPPATPTFAREVAPIVFSRCAPCHRPGGAGPFALLGYDDVARRATQIARVTSRHIMPPWKATGDLAYTNARRLGDGEIETLRRWAEAGAPLGDAAAVPPAPAFASGWQLGTPDAVVEMPAYELRAGGPDDYRNFVVRAPVATTKWVVAWELRANGRAIHHAIVNLDRNGFARKRDREDGRVGYPGMEPGDVQSPDGFYLVWTPGQTPTPAVAGQAWRIDGDTDLVMQLHMQPTGKVESVHPTLALYFTDAAPTVSRMTWRIGDGRIDIPPGEAFTLRDDSWLPVDVELLTLFPHLHYLGRTVRVWATTPDGVERPLLAIDDWDPAWQEKYVLAQPMRVPAGSTLSMALGYDNSEANPRNPNRPPVRVHTGERSVDEMGNVTFELRLATEGDKVKLRETKYRRELSRGGGARAHYNLGNTLAEQGRFADAVAAYRRAVELAPSLVPARANLGRALLMSGDVKGAMAEFEGALKLDPGNVRVRAQLEDARRRR
ncbi:MAG: Tetratricopeptide 2 repeat protein [Myxococcales bacterium]|nr:Tetratricopeptide 2 repeat protein [Myxococcales bacterium]